MGIRLSPVARMLAAPTLAAALGVSAAGLGSAAGVSASPAVDFAAVPSPIAAALYRAQPREWENAAGLVPSEPQIALGAEIVHALDALAGDAAP